MHWKILVDMALRYGVPLAQDLFARNWEVVVDDDGLNVTWEFVQGQIAEGRALAQQGISIADAEIAKQKARLEAEAKAEAEIPAPSQPAPADPGDALPVNTDGLADATLPAAEPAIDETMVPPAAEPATAARASRKK